MFLEKLSEVSVKIGISAAADWLLLVGVFLLCPHVVPVLLNKGVEVLDEEFASLCEF